MKLYTYSILVQIGYFNIFCQFRAVLFLFFFLCNSTLDLKYGFSKKLLRYKRTSDHLNTANQSKSEEKSVPTGQRFICTKVTSYEVRTLICHFVILYLLSPSTASYWRNNTFMDHVTFYFINLPLNFCSSFDITVKHCIL